MYGKLGNMGKLVQFVGKQPAVENGEHGMHPVKNDVEQGKQPVVKVGVQGRQPVVNPLAHGKQPVVKVGSHGKQPVVNVVVHGKPDDTKAEVMKPLGSCVIWTHTKVVGKSGAPETNAPGAMKNARGPVGLL